MGYLFRKGRAGGYNFWHDGKWDAIFEEKHHKFGAFFAKWDNGWTVVTTHNISAINGEHGELDAILSNASHRKLNP